MKSLLRVLKSTLSNLREPDLTEPDLRDRRGCKVYARRRSSDLRTLPHKPALLMRSIRAAGSGWRNRAADSPALPAPPAMHTNPTFCTCVHRHATPTFSLADERAVSRRLVTGTAGGSDARRKPGGSTASIAGGSADDQGRKLSRGRTGGRDARRKSGESAKGRAEDRDSRPRCEIVNDESARDFGRWRFRFNPRRISVSRLALFRRLAGDAHNCRFLRLRAQGLDSYCHFS
jgi:hypothetical protein